MRSIFKNPMPTYDDDADDDEAPYESYSDDSDTTDECPYCHEPIYEDAVQCPYCGQYISGEDTPTSQKPWWILIGVAICLALILFWMSC